MPIHDREQIQSLLETMRRGATAETRLSAARALFAQLNYDPTRKPLPAKLPDETKKQLASPPTIIATACDDQAFLILHIHLSGNILSRTTERAIVGPLLKDYPYALFVFSNEDHSCWHLLNVKIARKEASDDNRDSKLRRIYRRISVSPQDRLRTAIERIEKLDLTFIHPELFGLSPLAIQEAHDDAFDVEAVTKQFFQEYKRVFECVEEALTGIRGPDKRRLFTQRLFNRLMFIVFIQRKGWLKYAGMEDNEYIEAIWKDYQAKNQTGKKADANFYTDRLTHLFFRGLNNSSHVDLLATNRGHSAPDSFLQKRIGDVPYLNGGLFEKSDDGTDEADSGIAIPDKAINAVLHELFAKFNFTVTESTPLDVEVAVDPEMLGKVFEELVTGRHESGSYYTPKAIVSFMCREALKGYVETKCPKEKREAIALFVDEHDACGISNGESVLDALKTIKCCDPACGSGAYLLGMMHELLDLRRTLFKTNQKLDAVEVYQRKLDIIQTNVYGVDLDPFAINIARLRLWLSLVVEFDWENGKRKIPALPNLDFKIESGNSLAAPDPSGGFDPGLNRVVMDEFIDTKRQHATADPSEKKRLMKRALELRENLRLWYRGKGAVQGFDWPVEFPEVFEKGGFDAILANPPYVRQELIKDQKPVLKAVYGPLFSGTADLYVFFYLRALQLLNKGGMLAFISSNKWFRAGYGEKLRSLIARTTSVRTILDFHDLPVFESAIAYPMIFIAAKRTPAATHQATLAEPPDLESPYPDVTALVGKFGHALPTAALGHDGTWHLATSSAADKLAKMRAAGPTLGEYVGSKMYRGVLTGLNEAWVDSAGHIYVKGDKRPNDAKQHGVFVISGEERAALIAADPKSAEIIKPLAMGKDIKRWRVDSRDKWLVFTRRGIDIEAYPAIKKHLARFRIDLTPKEHDDPPAKAGRKPGSYKWYEIQDDIAYFAEFDGAKIILPDISPEPRFALAPAGVFSNDTTYIIPRNDLYLAAVLNSTPVAEFYLEISAQVRGGYTRYKRIYFEQIPIPNASSATKSVIAALAQKCLDAKGVGCEAWEAEIDERVAALYGIVPVDSGEKAGRPAPIYDTKGHLMHRVIPKLAKATPRFPYFSLEAIRLELENHRGEAKPESLKQYLYEIVKEGVIHDAGRGWYSTLSEPLVLDREPVRDLVETLEKRFPFLEFSCWSTKQIAAYGHHQLARFTSFVYTERDAMESVADALRETGKTVYVDPGKAQIGKSVKLSDGAIIVRPLVTRAPVDGHYASIEKVLVDLLKEADELKLIDEAEVQRVFYNVVSACRISISEVLTYAERRKMDVSKWAK